MPWSSRLSFNPPAEMRLFRGLKEVLRAQFIREAVSRRAARMHTPATIFVPAARWVFFVCSSWLPVYSAPHVLMLCFLFFVSGLSPTRKGLSEWRGDHIPG